MNFARVKHGADMIGKHAQTAYALWAQNSLAEAAICAAGIVADCRLLLEQANDLQDALQALQRDRVNAP